MTTLGTPKQSAIKKLYEDAIRGRFIPKTSIDDGILFIFPDGKMIGHSVDIGRHRPVAHEDIYKYISNNKQKDYQHFMFDTNATERFGLITIVPRSRGAQVGRIIIPYGHTPTSSQKAKVSQIKDELRYTVYRLDKQY